MEYSYIHMNRNMKDFEKKEEDTDKERWLIGMEVTMMVSG